jgi:hypothetical protein
MKKNMDHLNFNVSTLKSLYSKLPFTYLLVITDNDGILILQAK